MNPFSLIKERVHFPNKFADDLCSVFAVQFTTHTRTDQYMIPFQNVHERCKFLRFFFFLKKGYF